MNEDKKYHAVCSVYRKDRVNLVYFDFHADKLSSDVLMQIRRAVEAKEKVAKNSVAILNIIPIDE